jgi:histidinol dehydrogenase
MAPRVSLLDSRDAGFEVALARLLDRGVTIDPNVAPAVSAIVADVRSRGDDAVLEYTRRFDRHPAVSIAALEIPCARLEAALGALAADTRAALEAAERRIRAYHERQKSESWRYQEADGTLLGQQVTPLDRVGLYAPGGRAAYPSSVLMNAIPAKVAGVDELVMMSPSPDGAVSELALAAAALSGVDRFFTIGGAQAVAALAYGTATIPRVDKIVGPGNQYVSEAKRQVFGHVDIDMIAGPSEILILADRTGNADWIAADLLAQAEHDESAQSILITDDAALADSVGKAVDAQVGTLSRSRIAGASWRAFGAIITVRNLDEAIPLVDQLAPEHLEIVAADAETLAARIRNAGAVFIGAHTPEAVGDYIAGSNHVLPTARSARFTSGLGVPDFMKRTSLLKCGPEQLRALAPAAIALGEAEGLTAHARSVAIRLNR